jgi:hypothetical protein
LTTHGSRFDGAHPRAFVPAPAAKSGLCHSDFSGATVTLKQKRETLNDDSLITVLLSRSPAHICMAYLHAICRSEQTLDRMEYGSLTAEAGG